MSKYLGMSTNIFTIIVIALALVLGLFLLGLIQRRGRLHAAEKHFGVFEKDFVEHKWEEIQELVKVDKPSSLRQAVIEADKLLDYVLRGKGFRGETTGERMKAARSVFSDNDGVWSAHKLRNVMVHDSRYEARAFEMRDALKHFEKALRDLGGL